jgi:hypothetical protein
LAREALQTDSGAIQDTAAERTETRREGFGNELPTATDLGVHHDALTGGSEARTEARERSGARKPE